MIIFEPAKAVRKRKEGERGNRGKGEKRESRVGRGEKIKRKYYKYNCYSHGYTLLKQIEECNEMTAALGLSPRHSEQSCK